MFALCWAADTYHICINVHTQVRADVRAQQLVCVHMHACFAKFEQLLRAAGTLV